MNVTQGLILFLTGFFPTAATPDASLSGDHNVQNSTDPPLTEQFENRLESYRQSVLEVETEKDN